VMELVEGSSLRDHRPDDMHEILAIARQVCAALEHAHVRGIIHRDIKPENVLISNDLLPVVKLMDFGLARSVASRLTPEGTPVGTVSYLAPEQALGEAVDGRADLYALGVMLYELTTSRLPFTADDPIALISQHLHAPLVPPRAHNEAIPAALDALIVRLLRKLPEDRPASASEVIQALERIDSAEVDAAGAGEPSPLDRIVRGRLVGRERELAEANAHWRRAASGEVGEGRVLLISGEPGVGKTRFVRELATRVGVTGSGVLVGECYAEGGAPYAPIAQIVEAALDLTGLGDPSGLPRLVLADLITLAPSLRARYVDVPPNPPLDPQAEQQRLFESVVALFTYLAERAPLLLVIDDAHWTDGGTLALVRHIARRMRMRPVMIVVTYREVELDEARALNEVLHDLNRERLATRLKLSRLTRDQTRDLLATMFAEDITPEFLEGIYHETEGNPFFVEEVCKALIESGKLTFADGRWHRPSMAELEIPQSVRVAIQSRVGKLPEAAQETLRLAAIIGREFDFETLKQTGELVEDTLLDALERAERAQLIGEVKRSGQEAFAFAHALIPATLRESMSGLRRHRLHRHVASVIERLRPDDFEALGYHYGEAGDEERAHTYTIRAADRARKVYANADAIRLYTQALALMPADPEKDGDRFDLLAARAAVYDLVARREAQRADAEAMLALAEKQNDDARRCDALIALADFYLATEHFRAREPAERAAEIARRLGDAVREGHALRRLGEIATLVQFDFLQSRTVLEQAVTRFRQAGLPGETATCLHMLALTLERLGELSAAEQTAQEAITLSRETGDRQQEAAGLRRLGVIYGSQDRWVESLPVAQAALALHRELGDREGEGMTLNNLGGVLASLARLDESEACLRQALDIGEAIDSTHIVDDAISFLCGDHFDRRGDYEAELAFLETQLAKAQSTNNQFLIAEINWSKAFVLGNLGQFGTAIELFGAALATGQLDDASQSLALSHMARLQAERGEYVQARLHLQDALERWVKTGRHMSTFAPHRYLAYAAWLEGRQIDDRAANPALLRDGLDAVQQFIETFTTKWFTGTYATAFMIAARLYLALDEADKALTHSTEAVRLAAISPSPLWPERIFLAHAHALRAASREAEADDYLRRAYERVMLVAGKIQDETLRRSWLENVRENREIVAEWSAHSEVA